MFNNFRNHFVVRYNDHKEHYKSRQHFYRQMLTYYYPIVIRSYLKYEVRYFIPHHYSKFKLNMMIRRIKLELWIKNICDSFTY